MEIVVQIAEIVPHHQLVPAVEMDAVRHAAIIQHHQLVLTVVVVAVRHVAIILLRPLVPAAAMVVEVLAATIPQVHVPTVQSNVQIHVVMAVILVVTRDVEEVATMHAIVAIQCAVMVQKAVAQDVVHHVKPTVLQHVPMDVTDNQKILKTWIL